MHKTTAKRLAAIRNDSDFKAEETRCYFRADRSGTNESHLRYVHCERECGCSSSKETFWGGVRSSSSDGNNRSQQIPRRDNFVFDALCGVFCYVLGKADCRRRIPCLKKCGLDTKP